MENKITTPGELFLRIKELEIQQTLEKAELKNQLTYSYERIKPINLLKNGFREITSSPDFKDDLLGAAVGLTTGYLSKVVFSGLSRLPLKNLVGSVLQMGVSNIVSRHPEAIKSLAGNIMNIFERRKVAKNSVE